MMKLDLRGLCVGAGVCDWVFVICLRLMLMRSARNQLCVIIYIKLF